MSSFSSFLFARPSFIEGMARIWDFAGTLNVYNRSATPELADARAFQADWAAVGQDLWAAVRQFAEKHPELTRNESRCIKHEQIQQKTKAACEAAATHEATATI